MPEPIPVLLVEDNPGDARFIEIQLAEAGNGRFALRKAGCLEAALDLLKTHRFGVVLLDLSLPDSVGLDTFRRAASAAPDVPVVVLTGLADETLGARAVQEGAQDYLVKGEVTAPHLVHALHYAAGRHRRVRAGEKEMEVARIIYQHLLPRQAPACRGFEAHGASEAATAAGGDFYDYLELPGGGLGVVVGDVTDHGVGPALLMAATRAYLRAFASAGMDLGGIVTRTNRLLAADMTDGRNVTLLLAHLDPVRRTLTCANAGHPYGHVLDRGGQVRARLFGTGRPLGLFSEDDYAAGPPVPLEAGDLVLFLTDGVLDARDPSGERFGWPRALTVVRRHREAPPREVVAALFAAVRDFVADSPAEDDMTALVIQVRPE